MEHNLVLKVHYYQIVCMHDQHLKDLQQWLSKWWSKYYSIDKMCVYMCSCMI